jgi:hypothetical protein
MSGDQMTFNLGFENRRRVRLFYCTAECSAEVRAIVAVFRAFATEGIT